MLRRLSLRSRLVLGVLVLATIGLVAADLATYTSLRSFLISRTDTSLQAAHQEAEAELLGTGPPGSTDESNERDSSPSIGRLQNLTRSLPGLYIETRNSAGKTLFSGQVAELPNTETPPSAPRLPKAISLAAPTSSQPDRVRYFTVNSVKGDVRYRVRASLDPGSTGRCTAWP